MRRREFIQTAAGAGIASLMAPGCAVRNRVSRHDGPGFDVHPFIRENPDAVFIHLTDVSEKTDARAIHDTAYRLSRELIVPSPSGGHPLSTRITVKPNWTCPYQWEPKDGGPIVERLGINTDPNFVEGFLGAMRDTGPSDYYIRECACPRAWEPMGWQAMADRNGFDLRDLSTPHIWELEEGRDLTFVKVPDSVVTREVAHMAPINQPDTFLLNIAKFKAHVMGITACIKNLQGICARNFHTICQGGPRYYEKEYKKYFNPDCDERIDKLHARHAALGYPRWEGGGGRWLEGWSQRMLDTISVTPVGLNIVEGVYAQDGDGFGHGPHEPIGPNGCVTSRDPMTNVVIFGRHIVHVDIITHWMAGHEPGNFGLFHNAIERGLSTVLDPRDIPVYFWRNGRAVKADLDDLPRTPLRTNYLTRRTEPLYHMVDEPFDYWGWKHGQRTRAAWPGISPLGQDTRGSVVMGLTLPEREDAVYVDILNGRGEHVWRLIAEDLDPGIHQVVWENFDKPGIYNVYVRGMGWDAVNRIATIG